MKYILFGAGDFGLRALKALGSDIVECFADNYRWGTEIWGKKVISFEQMKEMSDDFRIMITSNDYVDELELQLLNAGISNYLVFNRRHSKELEEVLPNYNYFLNKQYMYYTDILLNYSIRKYKKIAIYGINQCIEYLLLELAILNDLENVIGIIDDNVTDTNVMGIPLVELKDVADSIDCLIINKKRTESNIRDLLETKEIGYAIVDIFDIDRFVFYYRHPELQKYKNIYKGKRAFIIGNGPSLKVEDLETLHKNNEICFGLNKIHYIYGQTQWRADYICMSDTRVIDACTADLETLATSATIFLADRFIYNSIEYLDKVEYVHLKSEQFEPNMPGFAADITEGTYLGFSVSYDLALQIAAYMGFKEIYLIGMDHNNVGTVTNKCNHFLPNYFTAEEVEVYKNVTANWHGMNLAYQKADMYSRKNGFRIYNATRGGQLEVFERVDFDSLFGGK